MNYERDDEEFQRLLNGHLDGGLSTTDGERLAKLLADDSAKGRQFARAAVLHHQIRSLVGYDRAEVPRVDSSSASSASRWSWFAGGALAASFVALAVFSLFKSLNRSSSPERDVPHLAQVTPIAYLAAANSCDWGGDRPTPWSVGRSVHSGDEITLYEGLAEFSLANGVSLSIEGPAALVLNSPMSLVLQHGRVTIHVPWTVTDFRAFAGACRLTGCDAEFGISVAGGDIDVHVFSGQVLTAHSSFMDERNGTEGQDIEAASKLSFFTKAVVPSGRALALVSQDGVMKVSHWHDADKAQFATKLPMAGPLPLTQEYVDAVIAAKPIGYWRFESQQGDHMANEVPGGIELSATGKVQLSGDHSNHVAEFGRPGSDCLLISRDSLDVLADTDYSVEVWMKPSHIHRGGVVTLLTEPYTPRENHGFFIELPPTVPHEWGPELCNRIRFLHRNPPGMDFRTGTSCFSKNPYSLRRWQHVVAVKEGATMKLYVDADLAASCRDDTALAKGLFLVVGQLRTTEVSYRFVGQLDELAIYNRALSQEEVAGHYKSIRWQPARKLTANGEILNGIAAR